MRPSGEILALERDGLLKVLDVAGALKRAHGIPRGEQRFTLNDEVLPMVSQLPSTNADIMLTLVRVRVSCRCCGRKSRRQRKHRACVGCRDAYYCDEICQRQD